MKDKIESVIARQNELANLLADPAVMNDQDRLKTTAREHSQLRPIVLKGQEYLEVVEQIADDEAILAGDDADLKEIAQEELSRLKKQKEDLEDELKIMLLPKDPNDDKNTIVEIRAGTGGEEAALFAADLFRLYTRFAERNNWQREILEMNDTGIGGYKEVIFSITGKGAYGLMKYESGVHRVQRVPKTEAGGRVHTSASTVAVLPEAEEAEIDINEGDLKIDTFRASGAGGQHVNKTESAIRITHLPSGLVVSCQDEKSQHQNRILAMKVLRSRLLAQEQERLAKARADARKSMVSTGDRSAKIRTYNFPQGRITDHRINYTAYNLENVMDGDIAELIEQLKLAEQQEQLAGD
ncbi:MAG TPA: peptide chain release factor 1 [Candidatus Marinimicrobia bacterium]|jgi:peptide chain release factor 1|nr:peptide chain release factor 1 [Candidatus Neomarinimicrobiota bacterium]MDP6276514.1 peptide chain release factor 1 [Candidatus Neomarinimicrobiota bacterium]MDP7330740.1 peptide chain release factor 1 [Candidatus Neomarinimicrobiota bacterium]HBN45247.1 peptide chain release factor 1 [Candidatus Neomarinimicrobiota bacterium]HJL75291.1 peptide chain release factor 1 [Candidatus Neomarinimicrobiota bacterium]|tara:strand:- start:8941 stop:10002 length:1062 start_codon:yes stop_codon:yes gene_type:complete